LAERANGAGDQSQSLSGSEPEPESPCCNGGGGGGGGGGTKRAWLAARPCSRATQAGMAGRPALQSSNAACAVSTDSQPAVSLLPGAAGTRPGIVSSGRPGGPGPACGCRASVCCVGGLGADSGSDAGGAGAAERPPADAGPLDDAAPLHGAAYLLQVVR
jgi:hypothetical protein